MAGETCLLPICREKGPHQTVRVQGIRTMIQRSKERGDDDVHVKLQAILDSQGENSSVECHKTCYCTYTSKQNVAKYIAKKRKEDFSTTESEPETSRVRRSQLPTFQLKKHCLICGDDCLPKDPKHPDRWERIIQCETSDRPGLTPFKDVLLDLCEQRNDDWGRKVEIRIKGVLTDLPAADAQYHKKCYDAFMVIPKYTNLSLNSDVIDDDALNSVINDMYANQQLLTWTAIELHDMYCSLGGLLSRRQMFQNLTNYLGNDIVVIRMEGCASVVGFRHLVGKSLKLVEVDSVDEMTAALRMTRQTSR